MSVGASTQFSGTGWDSIKDYSQVVDNDVIVWSNRGPGRQRQRRRRHRRRRRLRARRQHAELGRRRLHRVGDVGRHEPLDAGHGSAPRPSSTRRGASPARHVAERVRRPLDADVERQDIDYTAGCRAPARSTPAARSTSPRARRRRVTPDSWRPGGYAGQQWDVVPAPPRAGRASTAEFTVEGGRAVKVGGPLARAHDRVARRSRSRRPLAKESEYTFNAPDYLIDITRAGQAAPERRPDGRPGGLRPLAARPERRLHRPIRRGGC